MAERRLEGLALKVGPQEHDRLLSLLSDSEGVTRLAVPARRPGQPGRRRSTDPAAIAGGRPQWLARVRQLRVLRSF